MIKRITSLFILVLLFSTPAFSEMLIPEYTGYVNDYANILSDETEASITSLIESIKETTSAEVAVVTIQSLEGYDINEYSVELGRSWGVGNKERDDGVIFLTSVDDRKTYIATGYGVEGFITDAQAFWITDQIVVPYFKEGDYNGGILAGTQAIQGALLELEKLPDMGTVASDGFSFTSWVFWICIIFIFIFPWLGAVFSRSKSWWAGGVVGVLTGTGMYFFMASSLVWIFILGVFGLFFDYLASSNFKKGKKSFWTGGGKGGWGGGSSGWGGGSSGGSSSSGGFGGFSGGSFGGGGGGSSW